MLALQTDYLNQGDEVRMGEEEEKAGHNGTHHFPS